MRALHEAIMIAGEVLPGEVLKVDGFLNHQIDVRLMEEIGEVFHGLFKKEPIDKILTIETSGIAVACFVARAFNYLPLVFAKKEYAANLSAECYESEAYSYTRQKSYKIKVAKEYLSKGENVLIIDDFLAEGNAGMALVEIVRAAGAIPIGIGVVIEKGFQNGRQKLEKEGLLVESLAVIKGFEKDSVVLG